jgi:endonuclease/exonuclease/phosphatase (EEP) superfamily protein YafD
MHTLRKVFYYFLILVATLLILLSMLSLIHNVADWYTKVLDFPRTQYLIVGIACLFLFVIFNRKWNAPSTLLMLGLGASILVQGLFIAPYLVGDEVVPTAERSAVDEQRSVSIMLANVLITNDSTDALMEIVREWDPDLLLTVEVNERWVEALSPLEDEYPHTIKYPTDNAYGMAFYSKFPLQETELKFYHDDQDVPALITQVTLPSGEDFMFYGAHPVAPVPSNRWPDGTGEKERALIRIGKLVAKDELPAIVAGDFNDVSWSNTSRLFELEGHLNNVRLGRGLYNTFDANSAIMRWPLDHYFVSDDFALLQLERLPGFGSDHFPMYAEFVLQ